MIAVSTGGGTPRGAVPIILIFLALVSVYELANFDYKSPPKWGVFNLLGRVITITVVTIAYSIGTLL